MLAVDLPDVLPELVEAFNAYETALLTNDIPALNNFFWESTLTTRYGTRETELQYGHSEIASFRITRGAINQARTLRNIRITTFGRDLGVANTEYLSEGSEAIGRQSQTWARTDRGWKIVSAHVSIGR